MTPDAEFLSRAFDLGRPIGELARVEGGRLNRMWKLRTTDGCFAIKQLNATVVARHPRVLDRFRASEQIAATFAMAGIPAVVARDAETDPLREVEGRWFLVYPWIDGAAADLATVTVEQARTAGELIGRLHRRDLKHAGVPAVDWRSVSAEQWAALAERSRGQPWAAQLERMVPALIAMSDEYRAAAEALRHRPVLVSHRDVDQTNVLWRDDAAWLIDWEGTAWTNPMVELSGAAIAWSGFSDGRSDEAIFRAILDGYQKAARLSVEDAVAGLAAAIGGSLDWQEFSIRRALGEAFSEEDRAVGVAQTVSNLDALSNVAQHSSKWREWLLASAR